MILLHKYLQIILKVYEGAHFKTIRIKIFTLNVEVIFTKPIVLYIAGIVIKKAV